MAFGEPCPACGGSGTVPVEYGSPEWEMGADNKPCPGPCQGTGTDLTGER